MSMLWDGWVWVALAVPILYALDAILDIFFVGKSVYRNPTHATVLTGLFSDFVLLIIIPKL